MALGSFDRTPPPFFRQGPSALTKLVFFSALALFFMVSDARFKFAEPVRATLAVALLPAQRLLAVPVEMWEGGDDYLRGLRNAQTGERRVSLPERWLDDPEADAVPVGAELAHSGG